MSSVRLDPVSEAAYDVVAVPLSVLSWVGESDFTKPSDVKPTKLAQACSFGRSACNTLAEPRGFAFEIFLDST